MNNPNAGNSGAGGQDYLDKAFGMGAKKFGGAQGQKIAGNRETSEKIVSRMRPLFNLCWSGGDGVVTSAECGHVLTNAADRWYSQGVREGHGQEG
jgi:hypothetical protein